MKKTIWIILSSLIIAGCNNATKQPNDAVAGTETSTTVESAHAQGDPGETIELNNGEKWLVNAEMKPYIQDGEQLLRAYKDSHSEDYKTLAEALKEKNSELIKSCTMKGKSHEELHKWLHPHLELVADLGKAENQQQASDLVNHLQASFELFHQYFQ